MVGIISYWPHGILCYNYSFSRVWPFLPMEKGVKHEKCCCHRNSILFMLIDYVMFKNTHLNAYEEMIYHYGCIISVLILLCITTALVNQNKVIDTKNDVSIMDNMASSDA